MQVSKGGCGVHAVGGWMAALAGAGVEVVNVSPIRDDGPEAARATWLPIRPNTDAALLLALTHTLGGRRPARSGVSWRATASVSSACCLI